MQYESRAERRKALKAERKSVGSKVLNFITYLIVAALLVAAGWFGYNKLIVEPRLDAATTATTQELKAEFAKLAVADKGTGTDASKIPAKTTKKAVDKTTPIPDRVGTYEKFGVLYAPKLGSAYDAVITAGDDSAEISGPMAVDYYPESVMPGEIGNFLLAGHVGYSGMARFETLHTLETGDDVFVETKEGWYRYQVTGKEVVEPTDVKVLAPVPNQPGEKPTKAVMTMTTCFFEWKEGLYVKNRLAVWADYKDFTPRADGAPEGVSAQ